MHTAFFNSLTEGDFHGGFVLRQSLGEGDFWVRRQQCYALYRYVNQWEPKSDDQPVAIIDQAEVIEHCLGFEAPMPGVITYYHVHAVSSTGKQEQNRSAVLRFPVINATETV